jgi:hypothetical protein
VDQHAAGDVGVGGCDLQVVHRALVRVDLDRVDPGPPEAAGLVVDEHRHPLAEMGHGG